MRFFFFQAEDGIRDLVRSRGLGDVYKRQALYRPKSLEVHVGRALIEVHHQALWRKAESDEQHEQARAKRYSSDLTAFAHRGFA